MQTHLYSYTRLYLAMYLVYLYPFLHTLRALSLSISFPSFTCASAFISLALSARRHLCRHHRLQRGHRLRSSCRRRSLVAERGTRPRRMGLRERDFFARVLGAHLRAAKEPHTRDSHCNPLRAESAHRGVTADRDEVSSGSQRACGEFVCRLGGAASPVLYRRVTKVSATAGPDVRSWSRSKMRRRARLGCGPGVFFGEMGPESIYRVVR